VVVVVVIVVGDGVTIDATILKVFVDVPAVVSVNVGEVVVVRFEADEEVATH